MAFTDKLFMSTRDFNYNREADQVFAGRKGYAAVHNPDR
jgi:hypothetical protein